MAFVSGSFGLRTLSRSVMGSSACGFGGGWSVSPKVKAARMGAMSRSMAIRALKEGDDVPEVVFKTRVRDETVPGPNPFRWQDLTSSDIFRGKKVVLFALPGAFTPTCSSNHLPRYEQLYNEFKAQGVDSIVCLSVNDAFVMFKWGKEIGAKNVFLLPDGNFDFTKGMGMLVDKLPQGFGPRSWRYSMLVNDGKIEKIFSEPGMGDNVTVDPFEVSDADTMLSYLKGASPSGVSKPVLAFEG